MSSSNRPYLRSLPYQAPPAQHPPRRGRMVLYAAAGAALLVLGVAGAVIFANRAGATPEPPPARTPHERMLETLGGLSAAHLYQSYLNIGLLADAVENETYTEAQANN